MVGCILLLATARTLRLKRLHKQQHNDLQLKWKSAVPCTWEQLQSDFGVHVSSSSSPQGCWSLADEILRVPVDRIVNRNQMVRLGGGTKGSVFKGIVELSDSTQCSVALKSDQCFHLTKGQPWKWNKDISKDEDCVSDGTLLRSAVLLMGSEYAGALPFYQQLHLNVSVPGLLPTWGVAVDTRHPVKSPIPRLFLQGQKLKDTSIKAVIMPLVEFQSIKEPEALQQLTRNVTHFCRTMAPAAIGLDFVNTKLGLAFGDVKEKNMGIVTTTNGRQEAIVYDNSFTAVIRQPTQPVCVGDTCTDAFCPERALPDAFRDKDLSPGMKDNIEADFLHFRDILVGLATRVPRNEELVSSIGHANSMSEVIDVLGSFSK